MFTDVQQYVKYCTECMLNMDVKSKAPITRHIQANAPRETWVIDLLHYPEAK